MGKSQRGKWWVEFLSDLRRFVQNPALKLLQDAEERDTGHDDRVLREHWYWTGYLAATYDIAEMKKEPTKPIMVLP